MHHTTHPAFDSETPLDLLLNAITDVPAAVSHGADVPGGQAEQEADPRVEQESLAAHLEAMRGQVERDTGAGAGAGAVGANVSSLDAHDGFAASANNTIADTHAHLVKAISEMVINNVRRARGEAVQEYMSSVRVWHPTAGQKSYGKERRLITPPPFLRASGPITAHITSATLSTIPSAMSGPSMASQSHSILPSHPHTPSSIPQPAEPFTPDGTHPSPPPAPAPATKVRKAEREAARREMHRQAALSGFGATLPHSRARIAEWARDSFGIENGAGLAFPGLWVTSDTARGANKVTSFRLRLDLNQTQVQDASNPGLGLSAISAPLAIVSKPSQKTAKARSMDSCFDEGRTFALSVRIHGQTVRTRYARVERAGTGRGEAVLTARTAKWSPFRFEVRHRPHLREAGAPGTMVEEGVDPALRGGPSTPAPSVAQPHGKLLYGSVGYLVDVQSGARSGLVKLARVDRNEVVVGSDEGDPVSELQKVAFIRSGEDCEEGGREGRWFLAAPGARAGGGELAALAEGEEREGKRRRKGKAVSASGGAAKGQHEDSPFGLATPDEHVAGASSSQPERVERDHDARVDTERSEPFFDAFGETFPLDPSLEPQFGTGAELAFGSPPPSGSGDAQMETAATVSIDRGATHAHAHDTLHQSLHRVDEGGSGAGVDIADSDRDQGHGHARSGTGGPLKRRFKTKRDALARAVLAEDGEDGQVGLVWVRPAQREEKREVRRVGGATGVRGRKGEGEGEGGGLDDGVAEGDGERGAVIVEDVPDMMAWTIAGVDELSCSFMSVGDSLPAGPAPTLLEIEHDGRAVNLTLGCEHELDLLPAHDHDVYLGPIGPLSTSLWRSTWTGGGGGGSKSAPGTTGRALAMRLNLAHAQDLDDGQGELGGVYSTWPANSGHVIVRAVLPPLEEVMQVVHALRTRARAHLIPGSGSRQGWDGDGVDGTSLLDARMGASVGDGNGAGSSLPSPGPGVDRDEAIMPELGAVLHQHQPTALATPHAAPGAAASASATATATAAESSGAPPESEHDTGDSDAAWLAEYTAAQAELDGNEAIKLALLRQVDAQAEQGAVQPGGGGGGTWREERSGMEVNPDLQAGPSGGGDDGGVGADGSEAAAIVVGDIPSNSGILPPPTLPVAFTAETEAEDEPIDGAQLSATLAAAVAAAAEEERVASAQTQGGELERGDQPVGGQGAIEGMGSTAVQMHGGLGSSGKPVKPVGVGSLDEAVSMRMPGLDSDPDIGASGGLDKRAGPGEMVLPLLLVRRVGAGAGTGAGDEHSREREQGEIGQRAGLPVVYGSGKGVVLRRAGGDGAHEMRVVDM